MVQGQKGYKMRRRRAVKTTTKRVKAAPKTKTDMVKLIKNITLKQNETKDKDVSIAKEELYHNTYTNLGNPFSVAYPSQGSGDSNRIGDSIMQRGMKFRFLFGQKQDRHNVTFKLWLLQVPKGQTFVSAQLFDLWTNNVLLDSTNPDRVKVIWTKTLKKIIRPDLSGVGGGDKEFTFPYQFYLRRPKKITFAADNSTDPGQSDRDYMLIVTAYDAYGTLVTDNIAYVQGFCRYYFKDP